MRMRWPRFSLTTRQADNAWSVRLKASFFPKLSPDYPRQQKQLLYSRSSTAFIWAYGDDARNDSVGAWLWRGIDPGCSGSGAKWDVSICILRKFAKNRGRHGISVFKKAELRFDIDDLLWFPFTNLCSTLHAGKVSQYVQWIELAFSCNLPCNVLS
jgi:hypothetical protein